MKSIWFWTRGKGRTLSVGIEGRSLSTREETLQEDTKDQGKMVRCLFSGQGVRLMAVLVLVLVGAPSIFCQQITGSIVGTVNDTQGAVMKSATVKATNTDTGYTRSASTNGEGEFRIDYLPVGNYTVEASAGGFKKYVQQNV